MAKGGTSDASEGADPARSRDTELPVPQLRRGLFGYRRRDVEVAMASWEAALTELRDDVAALWVTFAEHDRAIDAARLERAASDLVDSSVQPVPASAVAPEGRSVSGTHPGDRPEPPSVEQQLADLDEVLSAIETATRTLEQSYTGDLAEGTANESMKRSGVSASGERDESG